METYLEKIQRLNKSYTYKDMDVDGITYNYLVAGDSNKEVITLLNGGIANAVLYAISQPDNVDVSDLVVRPTME